MNIKKRQIQTWLDRTDELALCKQFKEILPSLSFLDDSIWEDSPSVSDRLAECRTPYIFLWPHSASEIGCLPTRKLPDGRVQGPTSGIVIQYLRSSEKPGVVESGRFAVGYNGEDVQFHEFVEVIWGCLKKYCSRVDNVNPKTRNVIKAKVPDMLVGQSIANRCLADGLTLKYKSLEQYFLPTKDRKA